MKKLIVVLLGLFMFPCLVLADSITLDSPETIVPLTWDRITDWSIERIDPAVDTLIVKYRRRNGEVIVFDSSCDRNGYKKWYCRNLSQGNNEDCTDVDVPWDCCTGVGTGTCPEAISTCFNDVFGFQIRQQDVGTGIGQGLKLLIWNTMKNDVLTGGNDGTFD